MAHHDAWAPQLGSRVLINESWYKKRVERLGGPFLANLVEASWQFCPELGIPEECWRKLCDSMGRYAAALTILIIDRNARQPDDEPYHVRRPAGCAEAIARQWPSGGVNLRGLLMAGRSMNRDRALPRTFVQGRVRSNSNNIGQLMANALRNFDREARP